MKHWFEVKSVVDKNKKEISLETFMGSGAITTEQISIMRNIMRTNDAKVRAGLIELGWTPPANEKSNIVLLPGVTKTNASS